MTKALDLGCGPTLQNIFGADEIWGVDIIKSSNPRIIRADLAVDLIPFATSSFDFVTAHDFLQHIPRLIYAPSRRYSFIELINEIWRVLVPEGQFYSYTPAFSPEDAATLAVFSNPMHVNVITEMTFPIYFAQTNIGVGRFIIVNQTWQEGHLATLLRKAA